ncbi:GD24401 [Drosophila simulans]|uniref:GD24401 n=1 Tax=Drosophila simulans TaxID=7240 RepID=B4R2E0_DROSI|nr:GD24401 [Drosophila simulans]
MDSTLNIENVNDPSSIANDLSTGNTKADLVLLNEPNVNDPTSIANDLSTGNTKADLVLLNEPNVNDQTSSASDLTAENNKADLISPNKPEDFNSQILNIISDIDINIKAQEKITQLKEQELKLIQKQNDLANEIHKQQILAKQLSAQNQLEHNDCQSGELDSHSQYQNERGGPTSTLYQKNVASKAFLFVKKVFLYRRLILIDKPTDKIKAGANALISRSPEYANVSKTVDLRKIFTPATDAAEILPKNHFQQYQQRPVLSPNILPAYSDAGKHRVQLNIHQNQLIEKYSKPGLQVVQSPWKAALQTGSASSAFLEDTKSFSPPALTAIPSSQTDSKDWTDANEPMPHGSSRRHTNAIASSPRSVIVPSNPQRDLAYTPCVAQGWGGRSVELPKGNDAINPFKENSETKSTMEVAKLEKIPLKLIMNPNGKVRDYNSLKDLINVEAGLLSPDNCAELITALQLHQGRDFQQYQQRPVLSPNILPAYSDAGKHRVQLNIHQNQLIEKYSKPGLQVVQSPWKAALQTGSASSAFLEDTKSFSPPALTAIPSSQTDSKDWTDANEPIPHGSSRRHTNAIASSPRSVIVPSNPQRDLAYTPCVAQGWGGRSVELPKGLYVPKEISLSSYAAPSQQREIHGKHFERPYEDTLSRSFPRNNLSANNNVLGNGGMGEFPSSMPMATALNTGTLNQQPYSPTSYKKTVPGLEKVESFARYEQPDRKRLTSGSPQYLKALQNSQVRNASPIPFGTSLNEQTSWPPGSVLLQGGSPSPLPNHVQTFNKCAKGWGSIPVKQQSYSSQFNLPGNLPYSDF